MTRACLVLLLLAVGELTFTGRAAGQQLFAAVLPSSRTAQVGAPVTAFATITNAGQTLAHNCRLEPKTELPAAFSFQTTDPTSNLPTGTGDTPAPIPAGASQSFVFSVTPSAPFNPVDYEITFVCDDAGPAPIVRGVNSLLLSASSAAAPDVVALSATPSGDGIVTTVNGSGVLALATTNLGSGAPITVSIDTGSTPLPVALSVCQTNPLTGICLSAPSSAVTTHVAAGATPTFSAFVATTGGVALKPATSRIFVWFKEASGAVRGGTSAALRTAGSQPPLLTFNGGLVASTTECTQGGNTQFSATAAIGATVNGAIFDATADLTVIGLPFTSNARFTGTVSAGGHLGGTFTEAFSGPGFSSSGSGTFTGALDPDGLSLTIVGTDTDSFGETCRLDGTLTARCTSGNCIRCPKGFLVLRTQPLLLSKATVDPNPALGPTPTLRTGGGVGTIMAAQLPPSGANWDGVTVYEVLTPVSSTCATAPIDTPFTAAAICKGTDSFTFGSRVCQNPPTSAGCNLDLVGTVKNALGNNFAVDWHERILLAGHNTFLDSHQVPGTGNLLEGGPVGTTCQVVCEQRYECRQDGVTIPASTHTITFDFEQVLLGGAPATSVTATKR